MAPAIPIWGCVRYSRAEAQKLDRQRRSGARQAALPAQDNRFLHYRWQAVGLAQQAADLLPPKSQAYAAVLCNAASWVIKRDAKTGRALYQRYINTGTRYPWAAKFGYDCPAPDFAAVAP